MTKVIRVDDYTYELIANIIEDGKASNFADAINKALAGYAGIRYKSRQERKLEEEATHLQQLGKIVTKEVNDGDITH